MFTRRHLLMHRRTLDSVILSIGTLTLFPSISPPSSSSTRRPNRNRVCVRLSPPPPSTPRPQAIDSGDEGTTCPRAPLRGSRLAHHGCGTEPRSRREKDANVRLILRRRALSGSYLGRRELSVRCCLRRETGEPSHLSVCRCARMCVCVCARVL